jgi:hypothetical protein
MRIGHHLILRHRQKPYINGEIFANYIQSVFLPHLANLRGNEQLSNEEAVLLMDNCSPHLTPTVIELLTSARVRVVTFAPHTTHIFQVLDLALFGVLKRRGQYHLPLDDENKTADFIKRVYHNFRQTMIDANIWGAFREIGLSFATVEEVQRVAFDAMKFRESPGFKELSAINFSPEDLPVRQRSGRFGWINWPQ